MKISAINQILYFSIIFSVKVKNSKKTETQTPFKQVNSANSKANYKIKHPIPKTSLYFKDIFRKLQKESMSANAINSLICLRFFINNTFKRIICYSSRLYEFNANSFNYKAEFEIFQKELEELGYKIEKLESSVNIINQVLENQENCVKIFFIKKLYNKIIFAVNLVCKSKLLIELQNKFNSWFDSLISEFDEFIKFNKSFHESLEESLERLMIFAEVQNESINPDSQSEQLSQSSLLSLPHRQKVNEYFEIYQSLKAKISILSQFNVSNYPEEAKAICIENQANYAHLIEETAPIYNFFFHDYDYYECAGFADCPEFDLTKGRKLLDLIKLLINEFFRNNISKVEDYARQLELFLSETIQNNPEHPPIIINY